MNLELLRSLNLLPNDQVQAANAKVRVVVGMSGGVDSSVAALILKLQGYDVIGLFMKNWEDDPHCSAEADYKDVESVCEKIGIPYYAVNFAHDYKENVFKNFLEEYQKGHTPNPDILCNKEIKFKVFLEEAKKMGAHKLATGHYAQVREMNGAYELLKGVDQGKDQSYFLYTLTSEILSQVLFPIGMIEKKYVREIAREFGLITSDKKDSTGICFIGEREFRTFLSQYVESQKGSFIHLETGKILGQHQGQCFYTIGQRKGLGIGGPGGPWFVVKKDAKTNAVYVAEGENHPALYAYELTGSQLSWVNSLKSGEYMLKAKVRYRQSDQDCVLKVEKEKISVKFSEAQRAITVGQSVVFYFGEICLGGAIIDNVGATVYDAQNSLVGFIST
jgi:tRNA-specific 2-thiouridylase